MEAHDGVKSLGLPQIVSFFFFFFQAMPKASIFVICGFKMLRKGVVNIKSKVTIRSHAKRNPSNSQRFEFKKH